MKTNILLPQQEIDLLKTTQPIPMICPVCEQEFKKQKKEYLRCLKKDINYTFFCSLSCFNHTNKKSVQVKCCHCETEFTKAASEMRKTSKHFCSQSCLGFYTNMNKKTGTKRSKLELRLEEQLTKDYNYLPILYSDRTLLDGLELDIYIPTKNLAFEIQGIFHYKPIFGETKLKQIQERDTRKAQLCKELGIRLIPIDISNFKYITKERFDNIYAQLKVHL